MKKANCLIISFSAASVLAAPIQTDAAAPINPQEKPTFIIGENVPRACAEYYKEQWSHAKSLLITREPNGRYIEMKVGLSDEQSDYTRKIRFEVYKYDSLLVKAKGIRATASEDSILSDGQKVTETMDPFFISTDSSQPVVGVAWTQGIEEVNVYHMSTPGMTRNRITLANQERARYQEVIQLCDLKFAD